MNSTRQRRFAAWALPCLLALGTACTDGPPAGPDDEAGLTGEETAFLALEQSEALDLILDGDATGRPSVAPAAPGLEEGGAAVALSLAPIVTEFEFVRTRPCPVAGRIVAEGSGVHTADRETHTVTLEYEGTKEIDGCARERGDVVLTIDGRGSFEGFRKKVNGAFEGLQTHDQAGAFEWSTSDGREGACEYEIHVEFDPATGVKSVTGFVCDRRIERTVTRDR